MRNLVLKFKAFILTNKKVLYINKKKVESFKCLCIKLLKELKYFKNDI